MFICIWFWYSKFEVRYIFQILIRSSFTFGQLKNDHHLPLWNSCKVSTIILVLFVSVGATHLVHIVRLIRNDEVSTQQISIFQKYFKLIAQVHTHSDSLSSQFAYYAVQQSISITNDISWESFLNFILKIFYSFCILVEETITN